MSDSEESRLLDLARKARANADQARRLARQIFDEIARTALLKRVAEKEAEAMALEQQALNTKPPVIEQHQQPQQLQQAQIAQPDQDDARLDKPPGST